MNIVGKFCDHTEKLKPACEVLATEHMYVILLYVLFGINNTISLIAELFVI